jgi:hypothetical protein
MIDLKYIFKNEDKLDLTYDNQLRDYLGRYDGHNGFRFNGIIMKDEIKNLPNDGNFFCIINYDKSHQSGSHWIAIVKNNNLVYYFDSYGMIPLKEMKEKFPKKKVLYNDYAVQKTQSNICGQLCLSFIEHLVVLEKSYYFFLGECDKYSTRYKNDNN